MRKAYLDFREKQKQDLSEFSDDAVIDNLMFREFLRNQERELHEAMKDKKFAEAAFLYEMDKYEYVFNKDGDACVLDSLHLDKALLSYFGLEEAYMRARRKHIEHAKEWG